ncbi:hypothetical protein E2P81_ATG01066 [Venturia nashicola]|uniref:Uncharacterized protein n=1 Tax=Venturia nashicola TaxID=86259 RepID=A0A4Z1PFY6_9PEZI|nr:hypothetical protein E6O75_ATG01087 [Venturia nashicola]TLD38523.1 hypothetical protein E2P81_ATG01066 [Venturia nashicola]
MLSLSASPLLLLLSTFTAAQSTTKAAIQTKANSCGNCTRSWDLYDGGWWVSHRVTASIEAATVLVIENTRLNTTRTTTIFNLPPGVTLPPTNAAGTIVTTKTLVWNSKTTTTVLAWPTGYISYQEGVSWEGKIPAASSCSTAWNATFSRYPSLIPPTYTTPKEESFTYTVSKTVTTSTVTLDPYDPLSFYVWSFRDSQSATTGAGLDCQRGLGWTLLNYRTVYPTFPVYQYCTTRAAVCAASAVQTVAYLTVTSTSQEDTGPTTTSETKYTKPSETKPSKTSLFSPSAIEVNTPTTTKPDTTPKAPEQSTNSATATNSLNSAFSGTSKTEQSSLNKPAIAETEFSNADSTPQVVTQSPSTILLTNIESASSGTQPFTYISGAISTVVTPTTNSKGQAAIVLTSSVAVSQKPATATTTESTCSESGMAGYIMCGLGGTSNGSGGTTSQASLSAPSTTSRPAQVTTSGGRSDLPNLCICGFVVLMIGIGTM